jgi:hypothetical protein
MSVPFSAGAERLNSPHGIKRGGKREDLITKLKTTKNKEKKGIERLQNNDYKIGDTHTLQRAA